MQKIVNQTLDWKILHQERLYLQRTGQRIPRISFVFIHLALGLFLIVFLYIDRFPFNDSEKLTLRIGLIVGAIICLVGAWTYSILVSRRFKHVMIRWSQMEESYKQQEYLNQLKDQFISHVGHELRTPLTELYGFLDLVEQHNDLDACMRATFLEYAKDGCNQIITIVNTILDAMNTRKYIDNHTTESIAVGPLLREVLTTFSPQEISYYTIISNMDEKLRILAHEPALRQILHHLLKNAFTYCPHGTRITLDAQQIKGMLSTSSARVCLCVGDNGPGIPIDEQPLLFQRFVRLQRDLTGSVRGLGLGLFICKQLVDDMGGQIWVESSGVPGDGSRFYIVLPGAPECSSGRSSRIFNLFGKKKE